jgi:hypothetical protein
MNHVRARFDQKAREDDVAHARLQTGSRLVRTRASTISKSWNANVSIGNFCRSGRYIFYANLNFEMLGSAFSIVSQFLDKNKAFFLNNTTNPTPSISHQSSPFKR